MFRRFDLFTNYFIIKILNLVDIMRLRGILRKNHSLENALKVF